MMSLFDPQKSGGAGSRLSRPTAASLAKVPFSQTAVHGICGSMPLTNGSGSRSWYSKFFCLFLFEGTLPSFSKIKSKKKSQNSRNQHHSFSYYFCLMIEGSGSGSVPVTIGAGSATLLLIVSNVSNHSGSSGDCPTIRSRKKQCSGSGSTRQQATRLEKSWFLHFCDFWIICNSFNSWSDLSVPTVSNERTV
jgi:hypothetical protein